MASKFITINKKKYTPAPFDFNMMCELEDMGVSIDQLQNKPMSVLRAYLAISANMTSEEAGKEIEQHIIAGGNFDSIMQTMSDEMGKSDFFQALSKGTEETA